MNHTTPDSLPVIEQALLRFDRLWDAGQGPAAADFRTLFQGDDQADFVELIYHEFCRLEADDRSPDHRAFLSRYSEFAPQLQKLFEVHFGLSSPENADFEPSNRPEFPECGDQVGPFQLVKLLGQGMLGKVFLARQTDLGDRPVALKISRSGPEAAAELQAVLTHPNIMPVLQQFITSDEAFRIIVMPYRAGASLDQLLPKPSPTEMQAAARRRLHRGRVAPDDIRPRLRQLAPIMPNQTDQKEFNLSWPGQVAEWGARLAQALDYACQQGVIHGDIKPGNIYIDTNLTPCLLDFHLARRWRFLRHRRVLNQHDLGGTLHYLSPERLRPLLGPLAAKSIPFQFSALDVQSAHRGDLYGLGLVLLELLTGHGPAQVQKCPTDNLAETAALLCQWREHQAFLMDWPGYRSLPPAWKTVLARLLAPEPAFRFETGAELAKSLQSLARTKAISDRPKKFGRKPMAIAFILAVSLIWGSLTYISMQRAAYCRVVQSYWNMPDYFLNDPSQTAEIRLSTRLRQARLQLEPIVGQASGTFLHGRFNRLTRPTVASLDAEIWLAGRIEQVTKALASRALATRNADDTRTAAEILQFGIRRYKAPIWRKRYLELTGHAASTDSSGLIRLNSEASQAVLEAYLTTLDETDNAEPPWKEMLRLAPGSFGVRYGYAHFLLNKNKGRDTIEQLRAANTIDPNHFDTLRLLAYCEMDQAQYTSALAHLDKALNLRPDDISALRLQTICRIQTGQRDALTAELARIGEILEERPTGQKIDVEDLLDAESVDLSGNQDVFDLKTVERLAELIPNDVEILDLLMHKYENSRHFLDAIGTIQKIRNLMPQKLEYKINLAILSFRIGHLDQAIDLTEEILSDQETTRFLKKYNSVTRFLVDVVECLEQRNPDRARKNCFQLIQTLESSDINLGECHFLMARLILETENIAGVPKALEHLIQAGQQNSQFVHLWYVKDSVFQKYQGQLQADIERLFPKPESSVTKQN